MKFAVIGDPIGHSRSPEMHLPTLLQFDPEATYEKVRVEKGELAAWIERVRKENFRGFNITMPHKAAILNFLDAVDAEARLFSSVNTVVNREGRLYGYNTDANGFLLSLAEKGEGLKGRKILLLGAGGAARTIALKAWLEGAETITILARKPEQAAGLAAELKQAGARSSPQTGTLVSVAADSFANIAKQAENGPDILINATPLGMKGTDSEFGDLSFLDKLPEQTLVYDLIYEPAETALLAEAKHRGHRTQNGLKMLEYQALLADQLYLEGVADATAIMQKTKLNSLERAVTKK